MSQSGTGVKPIMKIASRLIALSFLVLSGCASISNHTNPSQPKAEDITSMKAVYDYALDAANNNQQVIVVFDVDNTLLTGTQDLGGVAWFDWQSDMISNNVSDPRRIIDFPTLFDYSELLYSATAMKPTQSDLVGMMQNFRNNNILTYALTARSPQYRDATIRELEKNDIHLDAPECGNNHSSADICRNRGVISACTIQKAAKIRFGEALTGDRNTGEQPGKIYFSGYSAACNDRSLSPGTIFNNQGREASVANGVMMVEGQNKGVMLELLLQSIKTSRKIDTVIFVDDSDKNTANVKKVAQILGRNWKVFGYKNPEIEKSIAEFNSGSARKNKADQELKSLLVKTCEFQVYCADFFKP